MVDLVMGVIALVLAILFLAVPLYQLMAPPLFIIAAIGIACMAWSLIEAVRERPRRG